MTRWLSQYGFIYSGDMQPGDREATSPEIVAWDLAFAPDLNNGLAIEFTGYPELAGTYSIVPASEIISELLYLQASASPGPQTFSNGQITKPWLDFNGTVHEFTITQFTAFAQSVTQYIDAILRQRIVVQNGGIPDWPSAPITIS